MSAPQDVLRWHDEVKATISRLGYSTLENNLILAIIWQESSGDPTAWNPEPRYRWFWDVRQERPFRPVTEAELTCKTPPGDFPYFAGDRDQEWWAQQASWGLMQIMGAAAREQGFRRNYIPALIHDDYLAIEFGIRHLWNYAFQKGNRSTVDALQRYNGGGNPKYAGEVLSKKAILDG